MKSLYNPHPYSDPINAKILEADFDEVKKFEPLLADRALNASIISEWLSDEYETILSNLGEPGADESALNKKAEIIRPLMEAKQAESKELWLILRITELIHKYDLKDEVEV